MVDDARQRNPDPPARLAPWIRVALAAVVVLGLVLLGRQAGGQLESFQRTVAGLGIWGPMVFVAVYVVACVLFGLGLGFLTAFTGAVLGSSAAFLIARHLARAAVGRWIDGNRRFAAIDRAIAREGLKITFLLRLSPLVPFTLLNYALGLTQVRWRDFLLASFGMIPGTLLYVSLGTAAGGLAAPNAHTSGQQLLWIVGVIATLLVTLTITRIARRALSAATVGDPV
jgi:uncharacterized membrane protein YdjX (TVP38/TMEM64 family)